jgi:hypothetical protein
VTAAEFSALHPIVQVSIVGGIAWVVVAFFRAMSS